MYIYMCINICYVFIYTQNHEIMFSPGYHYNDFLATHVLGHMMYV